MCLLFPTPLHHELYKAGLKSVLYPLHLYPLYPCISRYPQHQEQDQAQNRRPVKFIKWVSKSHMSMEDLKICISPLWVPGSWDRAWLVLHLCCLALLTSHCRDWILKGGQWMGEHEMAFPHTRPFSCVQPQKTDGVGLSPRSAHLSVLSSTPAEDRWGWPSASLSPPQCPLLKPCRPSWLCHSFGTCCPCFFRSL